jgi:hypothetical protein
MASRLVKWCLFAGLLGAGCAEAPELAVDTPLFVFNAYPASGATIARADLRELAVTFSDDLGEAFIVREETGDFLELVGPEGALAVVRTDRTNIAYDDETFTLRVLLDREVRAAIAPGAWRLLVRGGLESSEGRVLPVDYEARFVVAE